MDRAEYVFYKLAQGVAMNKADIEGITRTGGKSEEPYNTNKVTTPGVRPRNWRTNQNPVGKPQDSGLTNLTGQTKFFTERGENKIMIGDKNANNTIPVVRPNGTSGPKNDNLSYGSTTDEKALKYKSMNQLYASGFSPLRPGSGYEGKTIAPKETTPGEGLAAGKTGPKPPQGPEITLGNKYKDQVLGNVKKNNSKPMPTTNNTIVAKDKETNPQYINNPKHSPSPDATNTVVNNKIKLR